MPEAGDTCEIAESLRCSCWQIPAAEACRLSVRCWPDGL